MRTSVREANPTCGLFFPFSDQKRSFMHMNRPIIGVNDMDPSLYGEKWHPKAVHMDERRQNFEFALMAEVEKRRLPTLGVCFGSQLMNVYRGGSLIQFLPEQKPDALEHRK